MAPNTDPEATRLDSNQVILTTLKALSDQVRDLKGNSTERQSQSRLGGQSSIPVVQVCTAIRRLMDACLGSDAATQNDSSEAVANRQSAPTAPNPNNYTIRHVKGRFSVGRNPPMLIVPSQNAASFNGYYNTGYHREVRGLQGRWEFFTAGGEGSTEDFARIQLVGQVRGIDSESHVTPQLVHGLQQQGKDLANGLILVWVLDPSQFNLEVAEKATS
jgi:hypothetical protein